MTTEELEMARQHIQQALEVGAVRPVTRLELETEVRAIDDELRLRWFRRPARVAA